MRTTSLATIALALAAVGASTQIAWPQNAGVKRTHLQQHDLSAHGFEVIQVRVDLAPGVAFPRHRHPGEEVVFVVEGLLEYQIEDRPPITLSPGEVLFVPAGAVHSARNVGDRNGAELATYIVERGKPLVTLAE